MAQVLKHVMPFSLPPPHTHPSAPPPPSQVPAGVVSARVEVPPDCTADLHTHCYELHPRFHDLRTRGPSICMEARLQLVALYAAAGSLLPEPRSRMTGAQVRGVEARA